MAVEQGSVSQPHSFESSPPGQREQMAQQAEMFARALVKSFHFSQGKPLAQARYLVCLKYEKDVDLLAFDGLQLMADAHIQDTVLAAFERQHPYQAQTWGALDSLLAAEVRAVLNIARRLEGEGYRGEDLLREVKP